MTFKYRAKKAIIFKAPKLENPTENKFYSLKRDEIIELPSEVPTQYLEHLELMEGENNV